MRKGTIRFIVFLGLVVFWAPTLVSAALIDKAMGAYSDGRPADARRMSRRVLADNPANSRALLLLAKTEAGGRTAQSWAEQAIAAAKGKSPGDEATVFLLSAYASTRSYGLIIERTERFRRDFGVKNKYADAVRWWTATANLELGRSKAAETNLQWAVDKPQKKDWSRRLRLLWADSRTDPEQAVAAYKELLKVRDPYISCQTLLGLINSYDILGETDRALLYRGILNEKYPDANFYSVTTSIPASLGTRNRDDDEAARLAEIDYTVQLGAFSSKSNAVRLRDKYRRRGYTVHFFSRSVTGRKYWVVQVGSFTAMEKARDLMDKLQREDKATYRVVIR